MRHVLTFLSDFGSNSPYPAAMKAVAANLTDARFVDITHDINPHDLMEIALREGSAEQTLKLRVGEPVILRLP